MIRIRRTTIKELHGLWGHPLYNTWHMMKRRCYAKNNISYKNYGDRGIKVCNRWKNSFKNFLDDMGDKPSIKHTLDRKNNDGDYSPGNCRWATKSEQSQNRNMQKNNTSGYIGVYTTKNGKYYADIVINGSYKYLGTFEDIESAKEYRKKYKENNS